jgi:hypothetical protein
MIEGYRVGMIKRGAEPLDIFHVIAFMLICPALPFYVIWYVFKDKS